MADEEPPRSPTPEPEPDAARGASPERGRDEDRDRSPPPRGRDSRSRSRSPRRDDPPRADGDRGRSPGAYGGGSGGPRKIGIAGRWNSRGFGTSTLLFQGHRALSRPSHFPLHSDRAAPRSNRRFPDLTAVGANSQSTGTRTCFRRDR